MEHERRGQMDEKMISIMKEGRRKERRDRRLLCNMYLNERTPVLTFVAALHTLSSQQMVLFEMSDQVKQGKELDSEVTKMLKVL